MTRRDALKCVHEPFGDAFYFGPEFMSKRFADDEASREESGSADKTYADIVSEILEEGQKEGKRVFIKDMAYYIMSPDAQPTTLAPSLTNGQTGLTEANNPTTIPVDILRQFHFTFLIRHPRRSIPSYWRCVIPPLSEINGFTHFMPSEAGYAELVRLFDFLIKEGIVDKERLTVLDADDMLDNPEGTLREYCARTGIDFKKEMLEWSEEDRQHAIEHFAKWNGFHDDAIHTFSLKPRTHAQKESTVESENEDWTNKYGADAAKAIRSTVDENIPHYEYLRQFRIKA